MRQCKGCNGKNFSLMTAISISILIHYLQYEQGSANEHLKSFIESSKQLLEDFKIFKTEMGKKSETFTFWDNFVSIYDLSSP